VVVVGVSSRALSEIAVRVALAGGRLRTGTGMTPFEFVFMLTRQDRTVPDAAAHLEVALDAGVRHVGFKDVGLPHGALAALARRIREAGGTSYLEVVSTDAAHELASARAAVEIGVDYLLGGTRLEPVLSIVAGSGVRYYPFCGRVTGHPSVLEGTIGEIVDCAVRCTAHEGVDGLDLLAWRARVDAPSLVRAVCAAVEKPVIVAGSIDCAEQIGCVRDAGAAGFTIGTAALDGRFPGAAPGLSAQLEVILSAAAQQATRGLIPQNTCGT